MNELIALGGFFVAVYSFLPEQKRLVVGLNFSGYKKWSVFLLLGMMLLVIYSPVFLEWLNFPLGKFFNYHWHGIPYYFGFNKELVIFSYSLALLGLLWDVLNGNKLTEGGCANFNEIAIVLLSRGKFEELCYLISHYHRSWILEIEKSDKPWILAFIFDSKKFRNFFAKSYPKTALNIIYDDLGIHGDDIRKEFFISMLIEPDSDLSVWIRFYARSRAGDLLGTEIFPIIFSGLESNTAFSRNSNKDISLTIGDSLLDIIMNLGANEEYCSQPVAYYNQYDNPDFLRDSVVIGVVLYGIVVRQCIVKNKDFDIFIYYYNSFVVKILKHFLFVSEDETRLHYVIRFIFDESSNLISTLGEQQEKPVFDSLFMETFGCMLHTVIGDKCVTKEYKQIIFDKGVSLVDSLEKNEQSNYCQTIVQFA